MQEEDTREVRKGNVEGGRASVKGKGPKGKGKDPKEDVTNVEVIITSETAW